MPFNRHALDIDAAAEADHLIVGLQRGVRQILRRHGVVVGVSGGVDSSVVLALCVRAFGPRNVVALMMPEKDSDPETHRLSTMVARYYGVEPVLEDITPVLNGFRCYERRDETIRRLFPEYDAESGYKAKLVLPQNVLDENTLNFFTLTIVTPDGHERSTRLSPRDFADIVAATNFKQRARMSLLYYHAELRNYAVVGTANKNEHGQGFFVKYGDGGVDIKPIEHLFKTQVYQLARYLDVPQEIQQRPPTSDTYSAPTTQQEFFFRLPFEVMDVIWYGLEKGVPASEVASALNLQPEQVQRVFDDLMRKQRTTAYLRSAPVSLATPTQWGGAHTT